MIKLGVNVDHVATLRQVRHAAFPSPCAAAEAALCGGADGITVHLREDRRHIQDRDVLEIKEKISLPLNLEMAVTPEIVRFACRVRPEKVCLVPERRRELTTEGGLDVVGGEKRVRAAVEMLARRGIEVSLFIAPRISQIRMARKIGAPVIELHTGEFAHARGAGRRKRVVDLVRAAEAAHSLGLVVNAGHGLDYENVSEILDVPHLNELNIGHAVVAEAVTVGMEEAVRKMKMLLTSRASFRSRS